MASDIVLIGAGGFIGAVLRYIVSGAVPRTNEIPGGTLAVNVIGSFVLATLTFSSAEGTIRSFTGTGMLGSFTTFSTFAYESFRLLEEGENMYFLLNILLNLVVCIIAVFLGYQLMVILC